MRLGLEFVVDWVVRVVRVLLSDSVGWLVLGIYKGGS